MAAKKGEELVAWLTRIMPNISGPTSKKREALHGVVQSTLLYGAPVWHSILNVRKYQNVLTRVERKSLLRVASAYRTVSNKALQVITGMIPIHLLANERHRIYERGGNELVRTEERETTLTMWQEEWDMTLDVAQWTKKLIPNIREWKECAHRNTDYFLTQVLTGHGSFRTYLRGIGKTDTDICTYCDQVDTVEHTLFKCQRWAAQRGKLTGQIGDINIKNLINKMIENRRRWEKIHTFIREVMSTKEKEERRPQ